MPSSPENSDAEEPQQKHQKIRNSDEFIFGNNIVLLKVGDDVVGHLYAELSKSTCLPGTPLDDPAFWNGAGSVDGLQYTILSCSTNRQVVKFLTY